MRFCGGDSLRRGAISSVRIYLYLYLYQFPSPVRIFRWQRIWRCWVCPRSVPIQKHVSIVSRSCNYHAQAMRHIKILLLTEWTQTLACSLILPRIDYCNAVRHAEPIGTIHKLQQVENSEARIVLQEWKRSCAKPLLHQLHWLPVQQWSHRQLTVFAYKVRSRILRSSAGPTVYQERNSQEWFLVFSTVCLELAATNSFD